MSNAIHITPEDSSKASSEPFQYEKPRLSQYEIVNKSDIIERAIRTCRLIGKMMIWSGLASVIEATVMATEVHYRGNVYEDFVFGCKVFGVGVGLLVSSGGRFHEIWSLNPRAAERDREGKDVEGRDNSEVLGSLAMILVCSGFACSLLALGTLAMGEVDGGDALLPDIFVIAMGLGVTLFVVGTMEQIL